MPTTSPTRARKSKEKDSYEDIEILSKDPGGEFFVAKIFGDPEPFTFSTDVNFFLQANAFSGEPGAISEFLLSLVDIEVADDADDAEIERVRWETKRRFTDILKTTRKMTADRLVQFILDLTSIAGNAQAT